MNHPHEVSPRDLYEALQKGGLITYAEPYGCLDIDVQRAVEAAARALKHGAHCEGCYDVDCEGV